MVRSIPAEGTRILQRLGYSVLVRGLFHLSRTETVISGSFRWREVPSLDTRVPEEAGSTEPSLRRRK